MSDLRDSASPFGVLDFLSWEHDRFGPHYNPKDTEKSIALMREAGVGFVRFDFLWEDIEPTEGRFVFDKYDRLVDLIQRYGIKIQALLAYQPSWSGHSWNHAPDVIPYARYAGAVVRHFKDRIRHWQIWQEPDNPAFWTPQDHMSFYTTLLKYAYPVLKSADPTCVVHLGGLSRSLPMSLKHIYAHGGKEFFDVVDIHPFANPLHPGALAGLHVLHQTLCRVLDDHGDADKRIWFTEFGCPGMRNPQAAPNWWLGDNPTESQQAQWVATVYDEALRWEKVQKIFWCFFRDTQNHFKSGSDYDGLIRHDFSKKPSFETYRQRAVSEANEKIGTMK